jgi:hypothetical protein
LSVRVKVRVRDLLRPDDTLLSAEVRVKDRVRVRPGYSGR